MMRCKDYFSEVVWLAKVENPRKPSNKDITTVLLKTTSKLFKEDQSLSEAEPQLKSAIFHKDKFTS